MHRPTVFDCCVGVERRACVVLVGVETVEMLFATVWVGDMKSHECCWACGSDHVVGWTEDVRWSLVFIRNSYVYFRCAWWRMG